MGNSHLNFSIDCRNTNKRNLVINNTNNKIQPNRIRFNIGGIVFNFSQAILANYRGSLLEQRYMDYILSKNERYKEIWIARDPRLFTKLYSYLIHGNFDKFILENEFENLLRESEFYRLKLSNILPQKTRVKNLKQSIKKLLKSILSIFI
jgi:hypothetical protein